MHIRSLGPDDLGAMRELLAVFGTAFEDPERYTARQPGDAYLGRLLASDGFLAVAAFDGPRVVGGLTAYVLPKPEQEHGELYVYDLAVAESHRRRGIATATLEHLRSIARSRGAWVIFVQADRDDDPAIALYTKLGRREDVLHFDIAPAGEDEGDA